MQSPSCFHSRRVTGPECFLQCPEIRLLRVLNRAKKKWIVRDNLVQTFPRLTTSCKWSGYPEQLHRASFSPELLW
jgi:hypothetical protein